MKAKRSARDDHSFSRNTVAVDVLDADEDTTSQTPHESGDHHFFACTDGYKAGISELKPFVDDSEKTGFMPLLKPVCGGALTEVSRAGGPG